MNIEMCVLSRGSMFLLQKMSWRNECETVWCAT